MMTEDQIKKAALEIIANIAPEADIENLDPADRLRNQFDFDSVDFMNFAVALQTHLKVEIPEERLPAACNAKKLHRVFEIEMQPIALLHHPQPSQRQ